MSYIKNLICNYDNFALNVPYWDWPNHKISILTGPSGSGKSTLVNALCGFNKVEKGFEWLYKNQNLALITPSKRYISLMFQSLELFPLMNAQQNIMFPAQARNIPKKESQNRFHLLQEYLQLSSFLTRPINLLSGGEKQRVALARALMVKSHFVILDEPFSALDNILKKNSLILLKKILEQDKCSILWISHNIEEIKSIAQNIFYMYKGTLTLEPQDIAKNKIKQ